MSKMLLPHQYYYPHLDLIKDKCTASKKDDFKDGLGHPAHSKEAMIYIHIPFCDSKCAFCGFDKVYNTEEMSTYVEKLIKEMQYYAKQDYVKSLRINGIHFGGGTPTILPAAALSLLLKTIFECFNMDTNTTINIEGSATTLYHPDIISFLLENHISRVSVGVQTFNQKLRDQYKTKATLDEVYKTLEALKSNHIITYIDIMYGYPDFGIGNMQKIVEDDVREAISLGVEGIDFGQIYPYSNQLEQRIVAENLQLPSEQSVVDTIQNSTEIMESAGYEQKTAYGFTRCGRIIIETSYFGGANDLPDCLAFGSGAFGFLNSYKYRNVSYNSYMNFDLPNYSQLKKLSPEQLDNMKIVGFPKLLMLSKELLSPILKARFQEKLDHLISDNLITETSDSFLLTQKGKSYIDNIYYYLLEDEEKQVIDKQLKYLFLK